MSRRHLVWILRDNSASSLGRWRICTRREYCPTAITDSTRLLWPITAWRCSPITPRLDFPSARLYRYTYRCPSDNKVNRLTVNTGEWQFPYWHRGSGTAVLTPREWYRCTDTEGVILLYWHRGSDTVVLTPREWYCCTDTKRVIPLYWGSGTIVLREWYCRTEGAILSYWHHQLIFPVR